MTLVHLIVTGDAEFRGLGLFLRTMFPDVDFFLEKVNSFTSVRLGGKSATSRAPLIDEFADHLIKAVDPGRKAEGRSPDFVVAIDDLELFNLDQPEVVTMRLREAILRRVPAQWPSTDRQGRCFEKLRELASFHLLCPMLEAYFFTCAASLRHAKIEVEPQLVQGRDVEDFESCDATYLLQFANLPNNTPQGKIRPKTQDWFRKHPKEYLRYLIDTRATGHAVYRETKQGVAALEALSHSDALAVATQRRFLRSLVYDLADMLDRPVPQGELHPATHRQASQDRLLRNI